MDFSYSQYSFLYDVPSETHGRWRGLTALLEVKLTGDAELGEFSVGNMFEKIREGQIWRLITPIFLHGNIVHLLFNTLWFYVLGAQIERRLRKRDYLLLILVSAVVSNTAQYLMSGPFFYGLSGVVFALVGYIVTRQRTAPWEMYNLPKATYSFILVYMWALVGLSLVSFALQVRGGMYFAISFANTAHLTGLVTGMLLGRCLKASIPIQTR